MDILRNVLVTDARGEATTRHRLVASSQWDEIRQWSDRVYMPYQVLPVGPARPPDSVLDAMQIGHFTLSRFRYGIPVHLRDFAPEAGMGMVLTTVGGAARHWLDRGQFADTAVGEAFLVDNARAHYWADFDERHLQVNLTFEHEALARLHEHWFGTPADERLWQVRFRFGGARSAWLTLLQYVCHCVTEWPEAVSDGPLGRHLEEMIGVHLLTAWRERLDHPQPVSEHRLAPRHVLVAERYLQEHAHEAPTLGELARAAGVSVRTLTGAFRAYRGTTPMEALRERRLQGVRAELLAAGTEATVCEVAAAWGYANLGAFAAAYRQRFGELPSQTLGRLR